MKISEMVKETVASGITPILLKFDELKFFGDKKKTVLRSFMIVNSLDLGVLTYKQYRFVARRTKQGNHLVKRHLEKVFRSFPELDERYPGLDCVTIPVYARLLKESELANMLVEVTALFPDVPLDRICIELSADILYEDLKEAREKISELRDLGVKVAICEVGDEFCPVFRLSEIKFDYAFADEYTTASLDREDIERVAGSLVNYLHYLDVIVIAPELDNDSKIKGAEAVGFDGYSLADVATYSDGEEVAEDGEEI